MIKRIRFVKLYPKKGEKEIVGYAKANFLRRGGNVKRWYTSYFPLNTTLCYDLINNDFFQFILEFISICLIIESLAINYQYIDKFNFRLIVRYIKS